MTLPEEINDQAPIIVDSETSLIHVCAAASPFDVLGTAIYAHLRAIPMVIGQAPKAVLAHLSIFSLGLVFANQRKMTGYRNAWVGKAFEYAVAELTNRRLEPYWSLIREGIDKALSTRLKTGTVSIDRLSCVRVSKECANAENLLTEFGKFRILADARLSIAGAAKKYPGLIDKIDVLFCDRDPEGRRFGIAASLKVNRQLLAGDAAQRTFCDLPLDLAITVATPKFNGVQFEKNLGAYVVYLPMDVGIETAAWENATRIVEQSLVEGRRSKIIKFFANLFKRGSPENFWVDFLACRLNLDIEDLLNEIRTSLRSTLLERKACVPNLSGPSHDAVSDLLRPDSCREVEENGV